METILKTFKNVVNIYGENVALKEGNKEITYKELNVESNKIANYLKENGLQKGDFVSIYLKRSMETVISILGILKAGGVYVPLDPTHPVERNKYIINDTKSEIIITSNNLLENIKNLSENANILLMEDLKNLPVLDVEFTDDNIDDLAYIIYTSGTTGNPKGTLIRQRGVINLMDYMLNDWNIKNTDIIMQFATFSFDASILDTFASLYSGATLYLIDDSERMSEENFLGVIERENINIIPAIPTVFFNRIVNYVNDKNFDTFNNVKIVGVAGELLTGDLARKFKTTIGEEVRFFNLYGPTETTAIVTCYEVPNHLDDNVFSVPIGNDLPGTKLYVVNEEGTICETEEVGELWIASEGISLGYLNNKEKTIESFIENPFDKDIHGGKIYKSGDLVKRLADGNIEFISRKDTQVKIRGHRIEIAEIETRLNEIDGINDAVVVVETDSNGEKILKGFYTSNETLEYNYIVENLKMNLPSYMIPVKFKQIEDIPFAPTGKADRKALEKLEADYVVYTNKDTIVEARNEVEKTILKAWVEVLGNENIGVTDDLFEIGGHSLKVIEILSHLKPIYKVLTIKDFFDLRTVEKLAEKVENEKYNETEFESNFVELKEYPKLFVDKDYNEPNNILVTGSTGFLGSHIVYDLLKKGKNVKVIVRGDNGEERLNNLFNDYFNEGITDYVKNKQLKVIKGDLTFKNLGMNESDFNELALDIDGIIHSAADVRHFGDREYFEKINVEGTKNVFDLVEKNNKIVFHHISTVGVLEDLLSENKWDLFVNSKMDIKDIHLESVYTDTKFLAEKFLLDKLNENKEIFIYRMGNLIGRYSDGKFQNNIDNNAFYRMTKLFLLTNKAPEVHWKVDFTPIDFASEVVIKGVLEQSKKERIYTVSNPNPLLFNEYINLINEIGYSVDLMDIKSFESFILNKELSEEINNLAVSQLDGDGAKNSNAIYDSKNTMEVLDIKDIPLVDKEYISKMIKHMFEVNFINM